MTSEICILENDLCRCCLSKGVFINLGDTCTHLEEKETYVNMLRNSIDVDVYPVPGDLCTVTFKICDACVMLLLSTVKFKKQVLSAQDRFEDMISRDVITVADTKPVIKVELPDGPEDDYKDDFPKMDFDGLSDHDSIDIKAEDTKKVKAKKAKIKPKTKAKKTTKKVKSKKGTAKDDIKSEDEEKTGGNTKPQRFKLRNEDFTQDGDLLKCRKCEKTYHKLESLKFHVRTKHFLASSYVCNLCDEKFQGQTPLVVHKFETHQIDERLKCNACDVYFHSKRSLQKHNNCFHMLGVKFKCNSCEYESFSSGAISKHRFVHRTVKDYHCRFCKKSFLRKATLNLHEKIHTDERRKVCKVCGQAFVQKASLNYHMNKYHPGEPF